MMSLNSIIGRMSSYVRGISLSPSLTANGDHDHDPQFEVRIIKSPQGWYYRLHTDDYTWRDEESRGIGSPDVTEEFHTCGVHEFFKSLAEAKFRGERAARIDAHVRERSASNGDRTRELRAELE
jgi:hypothetical protein